MLGENNQILKKKFICDIYRIYMYREYRCDLVFLSSWKFYQHSFDVRICFRKECRIERQSCPESQQTRYQSVKTSTNTDNLKMSILRKVHCQTVTIRLFIVFHWFKLRWNMISTYWQWPLEQNWLLHRRCFFWELGRQDPLVQQQQWDSSFDRDNLWGARTSRLRGLFTGPISHPVSRWRW